MYLKFTTAQAGSLPRVGSMMTIEHPDPKQSGEYIVVGTVGEGSRCSIRLKPIAEWQDEQTPPLNALAMRGDRVIRPEPGEHLASWMNRIRTLMCEV